jgi:hypothetical protein
MLKEDINGILTIPEPIIEWKSPLTPKEYQEEIKSKQFVSSKESNFSIIIDAGSDRWRAGWNKDVDPLRKLVLSSYNLILNSI